MFKKGERPSFSFSNENVLLVYLNDQKSLNFSAWLREENNTIMLSKHRLQNSDFKPGRQSFTHLFSKLYINMLLRAGPNAGRCIFFSCSF